MNEEKGRGTEEEECGEKAIDGESVGRIDRVYMCRQKLMT